MPLFQISFFFWRTVNSKQPTIPIRIVACTFSDNLSLNSCRLQLRWTLGFGYLFIISNVDKNWSSPVTAIMDKSPEIHLNWESLGQFTLTHSRTFLDLQIIPRHRNWDWAIVTWLPCQFFLYLYSGGSRGRARGTRPPLIFKPNRPFYRYGGHIELILFKEYYRMPRGHEHISFVFLSAFRDTFS